MSSAEPRTLTTADVDSRLPTRAGGHRAAHRRVTISDSRRGILAGALGATPTLLPAFAVACAQCVSGAAAVGAVGAAPLTPAMVLFGVALVGVVASARTIRICRTCTGERRARLHTMLLNVVVGGVLGFALMNWILAPWIIQLRPSP
jgi:hypothetical protein